MKLNYFGGSSSKLRAAAAAAMELDAVPSRAIDVQWIGTQVGRGVIKDTNE